MNISRILAIGPKTKKSKGITGGLSVMFDGFVDKATEQGIEVKVVNILQRWNSSSFGVRAVDISLNFVILFGILLKSVIFNKKIDICYFTSSLSANGVMRDYVIVKMLNMFHVPVVAHQFGATTDHFTPAKTKIGENKFNWLIRYFSHIIVEGDLMRRQFEGAPVKEDRITVLPNGLPETGRNALKPKDSPKGTFTLFWLSNLIFTKGWLDVLEAMSILVNDYKLDVKCTFAGKFMPFKDDPVPMIYDENYFLNYIKEHDLGNNIVYYPALFGEEKNKKWLESNVFLLPSYYVNEGQPVSILEALSYGCVPIVTNYRHIPMMVNEQNGCFVEPKSPEQIADAVKYLIETPNVYSQKSKRCIEDFENKFSYENYSKQIFTILNKCCNSTR